MGLDKKFYEELAKVKANFEEEASKIAGQRIELKLIPGTQFIYTADLTVWNRFFAGCFSIEVYHNPYGGFLGGKDEPLLGTVSLGTIVEGTLPTSIITKTVSVGFMKKKRVFLPFPSEEFVDRSKGTFRIETEKIFKDQIGFDINPVVQQMNNDIELMDLVQKIPVSAARFLDWTGKRSISTKIDDSKNDLVTACQIVPHSRQTLVAFQFLPDWDKKKLEKLDPMVNVSYRVAEYIKRLGYTAEVKGTVAHPWVNEFLKVLLIHLQTNRADLPRAKEIVQNFTT